MTDVLVAGAGPAGLALAGACVRRGLRTTLVAPRPDAPWPTYGMWADEAAGLPGVVVPVSAPGVPVLPRRYFVLDNDAARAALSHSDIEVCAGRVRSVHRSGTRYAATLSDGRTIEAGVVVNATGPRRGRAAQTAFGVVLSPAEATEVAGAPAVFMDWRRPPGFAGGTFLYAVPVADGVLVEETCLARRPGLPVAELRARLTARLAEQGIPVDGRRTETVRIPLDGGIPRPGPIVPFGAAAGLIHPATGYSVADALRLAPNVADAIKDAFLSLGARKASCTAWRVLWPARAMAVHALRRRGLAALLALGPDAVPEFFELFFTLPAHLQRAYLSGRADLSGTAAAMAALFRAAPTPLRSAMLGLPTQRRCRDA